VLRRRREDQIWGIILILVGVLILISLSFYSSSKSPFFTSHPRLAVRNYIGQFGILVATYLYLGLGIGAFFLPLIMIGAGVKKFRQTAWEAPYRQGIGAILLIIAFCSSLSLVGLSLSSFLYGGGILGFFFARMLLSIFGRLGSAVVVAGLFVLSVFLLVELSPTLARLRIKKKLPREKKRPPSKKLRDEIPARLSETSSEMYALPSLSLFNSVPHQKGAQDEVKLAGQKLEKTLGDFAVPVEIEEVKEGPVVNRFEIKLGPGIKVNKIMGLSSDLALSLAVPNVRIEVPVSGKSLIGIEVPKKKANFVYLKGLLEEEAFRLSPSRLFFPLGKDITGETVWVNLESLPHLLIGGATGSGKSVCVNSFIVSILYRCSPYEVKFLLIDPKTVELVDYEGIPHLIFPPINEVKEAGIALEWIVREMRNRYERFSERGVRDIMGFNERIEEGEERVPYLLVIIDELADLMMMGGARLEKTVCRIAQLGRATGIHLVVATQRPSVDVITGLIKANFPSRISFAVASQVDSRTILDATGAEKLVGNGDMLYSPVEAIRPFRVQGSFISPQEVKRIVEFIREQGKPEYREEIVREEVAREEEGVEHDSLYSEAKELIMTVGRASTSLLQRRLSIGYNRAARIMDELEKEGVVGPAQGSKPREVLIRKDYEK